MRIIDRLAQEPAALGGVVASVLPALVVLNLVSLDDQAIGVVVVAVNALVGFIVRLHCAPHKKPPGGGVEPEPASG